MTYLTKYLRNNTISNPDISCVYYVPAIDRHHFNEADTVAGGLWVTLDPAFHAGLLLLDPFRVFLSI